MGRFRSLMRGVVRRLVSLPLHAVGVRMRTEAVANLSEKMFTDVAVNGRALRFFTPSPSLMKRADEVLIKEPDMIRWLNVIERGSVLWDIGANVGVFSLYAAIMREVSVLTFEPLASNFHVLSRNIQINNLDHRVNAFCVAFADASQLGVLNMASPEMGASLSQFGQPGAVSRYWDGPTASVMQGMVGFAIDEFIERFRPPFPNYLKIDVDGLEWPILRGAKQTLNDPRLRSAMIELSLSNQTEREEAIHFLQHCGLCLLSSGEVQGTISEKAANHLFERHT